MVWRIAVALLAVGFVSAFLFTQSTRAGSKGPVPVAVTDDPLAQTPAG